MGPVESSLRWAGRTCCGDSKALFLRTVRDISLEARACLYSAAASLGMPGLPVGVHIFDVYSEAIEAAEALGL
jgi:hypothetical protein